MAGNKPAFPQHGWTGNPEIEKQMEGRTGLTKRELFAAMALQAWISGPCQGDALDCYEGLDDPVFTEHQAEVAKTCCGYADALLAELEKPR